MIPVPERAHARTTSRRRLYALSFGVWFGLLGIAIVNGGLRELLLAPRLGSLALPVSGLTAMAAFLVAIGTFVHVTRPSVPAALRIGLLWLVLTLAAETLLTLATGRPALEVLSALGPAAISSGNLMAPLLVIVTLAPVAFAARQRD